MFQNAAKAGSPTNTVDVRTNGKIEMKDSSHICGNVTPGPGQTATTERNDNVCPGKSTAPRDAAAVGDFHDYDPSTRPPGPRTTTPGSAAPPRPAQGRVHHPDGHLDATKRELTSATTRR